MPDICFTIVTGSKFIIHKATSESSTSVSYLFYARTARTVTIACLPLRAFYLTNCFWKSRLGILVLKEYHLWFFHEHFWQMKSSMQTG